MHFQKIYGKSVFITVRIFIALFPNLTFSKSSYETKFWNENFPWQQKNLMTSLKFRVSLYIWLTVSQMYSVLCVSLSLSLFLILMNDEDFEFDIVDIVG
jgi:hypothetical protein